MQYFTIGAIRTKDMLGVDIVAQLHHVAGVAHMRKLYVATLTYRDPIELAQEHATAAAEAAAESIRSSLSRLTLPF